MEGTHNGRDASSATPGGTAATIVVPAPTGSAATDTPNVLAALAEAQPGQSVVLQWSFGTAYSIDQELPLREGVRLTGLGSNSANGQAGEINMPTLQQAAATSLVCLVGSANFLNGRYGPDNPGLYPEYDSLYGDGMPSLQLETATEIDHLAFDGQNGGAGSGNVDGHGIVVFSFAAAVHDCYLVDIANDAIFIAGVNYAGTGAKDPNHEQRVYDNTIVNPGWSGIHVGNDPLGHSGSTDGYMFNNLIESPSQQLNPTPNQNPSTGAPYEAIRMSDAAGWWLCNNRMVACPRDGLFTNTTGGFHLMHNVVDGFGCDPTPHSTSVGFNITTAGQTKLHPGRIVGNLVIGYEADNPYSSGPKPTPSATFQYYKVAMETTVGRQAQSTYDAYFVEAGNVAHQATQPPAPIPDATIPAGNPNKVEVPAGAAAAVLPGMTVADRLGSIPKDTTVKSVTPGAAGADDVIFLSAAAAPAAGDVLYFPGPTSHGWTYVNSLPAATMHVQRTIQVATGTTPATPTISVTPVKGRPDPAILVEDVIDYAGGVRVDPTEVPSAEDILLVGDPAGTGAWGPSTGAVLDHVGGLLSGTFARPEYAPGTVVVHRTSGTYDLPVWVTAVRVTCVGGGGGGGGGLGGRPRQVGGAGGAAGTSVEQIVDLPSATTLAVTIGRGGPGGRGATTGRAASDGGAGHASAVRIGALVIEAAGGGGGPGAIRGTEVVPGAVYGAAPGVTAPATTAACGGSSGARGGYPFEMTTGGGGGGGSATARRGGGGGGAGTPTSGGSAGGSGTSGRSTGGDGEAGRAPGAPGGGGGGGASAAGGSGGEGAAGYVVIQIAR